MKISKIFLEMFVSLITFVPLVNVKAINLGGINVDTVTSGDGLYQDQYENGRYVYKGGNPNNYIALNLSKSKSYDLVADNMSLASSGQSESACQRDLNNALLFDSNATGTCVVENGSYRITLNNFNMSTYKTEDECQNALNLDFQYDPNRKEACVVNENYSNLYRIVSIESDGTIKLLKNNNIGYMPWNNNKEYTDWEDSSLNSYLNNEWYKNLNGDVQKLIVNHNWPVGGSGDYVQNLLDGISGENSKYWKGNVGLISTSDYYRAFSNMDMCGNGELFSHNKEMCREINWIYRMGGAIATISNDTDERIGSPVINSDYSDGNYGGYLQFRFYGNDLTIYPSFYITSNIKLAGSGTRDNPYVIINEENNEEDTSNESSEPQIVEVPSTSAYASIIIAVLGIICVIVSVFVMRRVTKKAN